MKLRRRGGIDGVFNGITNDAASLSGSPSCDGREEEEEERRQGAETQDRGKAGGQRLEKIG